MLRLAVMVAVLGSLAAVGWSKAAGYVEEDVYQWQEAVLTPDGDGIEGFVFGKAAVFKEFIGEVPDGQPDTDEADDYTDNFDNPQADDTLEEDEPAERIMFHPRNYM